MNSLTIHIFDAVARDQRILRATEDEIEREYISDSGEDSDGSFQHVKSKKHAKHKFQGRQMVIYLFGTTAEGNTVRVEVSGFRPYFFVALPTGITQSAEERIKAQIDETLRGSLKDRATGMKVRVVHKRKLYGFTGNRMYSFLEISVPSLGSFYEVRKQFVDQKVPGGPWEVFESNIDPMLRFFHAQNLQPCGWVSVKGEELEAPEGTMYFMANHEDVTPTVAPEGLVSAPFLHGFWDVECYSHDGEFPLAKQGYRRVAKQLWLHAKTADEAANLMVAAFRGDSDSLVKLPPLKPKASRPREKDIRKSMATEAFQAVWEQRSTVVGKAREECIQSLNDLLDKAFGGVAPIAGDPIIQIGTVKWKSGSTSEKHVFVLGDCAPIEGVTVYAFKTEAELLRSWCAWIVSEGFDVLVGYNIFGFDEKYVWNRLEELGLEQDSMVQDLSRLLDCGVGMDLKETFLSSAALGDNMLYMWTTPGRLRIDLYGHIKRKAQMTSYKLDAVCASFLSGKLSGIEGVGKGRWLLRTKQKGDARLGRFVQVLDEFGEDLTEKAAIVEITKDGLVVESEEDFLALAGEGVKWAVVKDDVSPQEIFRLHRGNAADRARVAAYCVQDCDLVLELYKKLEVFNEAMSMANVCSVPIGYIFTRGQGIKIESLIYKYCREKNQLIQVLPQVSPNGGAEDSYEGAIVLDPEAGFYTEAPVGVCDFASLYPSTIISENISHDMLVWTKDFDLEGRLGKTTTYSREKAEEVAPPGTTYTDIEFDIWRPDPASTLKHPKKIKTGIRLCRFAQLPDEAKGTLPEIVGKLLAARKAKRAEMAKTEDPFKKALLDAEQNAYKITANSLYGQLGSRTFKIRLQDLAASVTAYGRKQILFSKAAIEKFYGPEAGDPRCSAKIVYGDTDSIFVCFNPRDPQTGKPYEGREAIVKTIELTEEAGKFITGALKAPHDFEYDKVFYPFIIFSKKRYVGNKYEDSPDEFKETSMGIVLKRRDNAPLLKLAYGSAIYQLLNHRNVVAATESVKGYVADLMAGKTKFSQLTITKSLSADYAGTPPAHKMLANRIAARDPGNAPASGERIGYVYIKTAIDTGLQGDKIETPAFIQQNKLEIDAKYYIEHQLLKPLSELFSLLVEKMPGYDPRMKGAKDKLAADLLFGESLAACDSSERKEQQKNAQSAKENFIKLLSGKGQAMSPVSVSKSKYKATSSDTKVQVTLQDAFADGYLAKRMMTSKQKTKTAAQKANAKTTNTAESP